MSCILFQVSETFVTFLIPKVGHAYMNRPCLDPSDPDCPLSAPNKEEGEVKPHILLTVDVKIEERCKFD